MAQRRIYTSTFNIRALELKLAILALMVIVRFADAAQVLSLFGLLGLQLVQMVVLPLLALLVCVRAITLPQKILLQVMCMYLGSIDIWYGGFRCAAAPSNHSNHEIQGTAYCCSWLRYCLHRRCQQRALQL
jgi:hypothetical protein